MTFIAGVDEAGRGSVIGPLVVAGVMFDEADLPKLTEIGVKDSKVLTYSRRKALFPKILGMASGYEIVLVNPHEIDHYVLSKQRLRKLNWLEALHMAEVIRKLKPDIVYVDASDVVPLRFGQQIQGLLPLKVKIISEHFSDKNYPIVGAASVVAKVTRDLAVERLRQVFGDLGSGYPSDRRTVCFLEQWNAQRGSMPNFVRSSWKTVRRITGVNP
ncbi:MAG: ribonuclease HII [Candidatus Bathyarchaeia archaeon]